MIRRAHIFAIVALLFVISAVLNMFLMSRWTHNDNSISDEQRAKAVTSHGKENACILMYGEDSLIDQMVATAVDFENKINHSWLYPLVVLGELSSRNKERLQVALASTVLFGSLGEERSFKPQAVPKNIDAETAHERQMERYRSVLFSFHPVLKAFDYYWRIPAGARFPCRLRNDPFRMMRQFKYDFSPFFVVHAEKQSPLVTESSTCREAEVFWSDATNYFKHKLGLNNPGDHILSCFRRQTHGKPMNDCLFIFDSEISSFSIWRSMETVNFFIFLDKTNGGFYANRALTEQNVRSAILAFLVPNERIHFFKEIGVGYKGIESCPNLASTFDDCDCRGAENFTYSPASCIAHLLDRS